MDDDNLDYDKLMRDVSRHQAPIAAGVDPTVGPRIIPPVLYIPVREISGEQYVAEVRELPDARRALVAYTALDRLAENCGAAQPWILVQTDELGTIRDEQPFDVVSFDPHFSEHLIRNGRLV